MNRTRFTLREEDVHRLRPPEMAVLASDVLVGPAGLEPATRPL
jgi:hypothetical protein